MTSKIVSAENILKQAKKTSEPEKSRTTEINYWNRSSMSVLLSTIFSCGRPTFLGGNNF